MPSTHAVLAAAAWPLGVVATLVVAAALLALALAVALPLARTGQLRTNALGTLTAGLLLGCAAHHVVLAASPALRAAWSWPLVACDAAGALAGLAYWARRRTLGAPTPGPQLFADLRRAEQHALELNDTVVQGLVVAQMSLALDQPDRARAAIESSIASTSRIITELLGNHRLDLVRAEPASLGNLAAATAGPPPGPVTAAGPVPVPVPHREP